jgi:hypothetical protein
MLLFRRTVRQRGFWIDTYFLYIAVITSALGVIMIRKDRAWTISDWLINYQGGYVRRGLAGEIFYLFSRLLHISPIAFVLMAYFAAYAVLLLMFRRLVQQSTRELWVIAILLSPATLAFPILDMSSGFRKEIVFLALLSAFLASRWRNSSSTWLVAVYLTCAIPMLVLVHEPLICFAPYFFAGLLLAGNSMRQAIRLYIVPYGLGLVAAFFSAKHIGGHETAVKICASLGYPLDMNGKDQVCSGGAIAYLAYTREFGRQQVEQFMQKTPWLTVYSVAGLLSLAPACIGSLRLARAGFARQTKIVWATAAVSFACSLILFALGVDWGRWIYVHVFSIAMLLLFLDKQRHDSAAILAHTPAASHRWRWVVAGAGLAAYATLWTLPHTLPWTGPNPLSHGYISLFEVLHRQFLAKNSTLRRSL